MYDLHHGFLISPIQQIEAWAHISWRGDDRYWLFGLVFPCIIQCRDAYFITVAAIVR